MAPPAMGQSAVGMDDDEKPQVGSAAPANRNNYSVRILVSHMTAEYEKSAIEISLQAFDYYKMSKDIATYIKKEYDKRYPSDGKATDGVYHCIVGKHFAASISHETRYFIHLQIGQTTVIIFKSKDSPFDTDQVELGK